MQDAGQATGAGISRGCSAKATNSRQRPMPLRMRIRHNAPDLPEPIFENMQMVAYDLWNYESARDRFRRGGARAASGCPDSHSETDAELQYSIVLVACPDIYNNLHKLYSAVTDKYPSRHDAASGTDRCRGC